MKIKQILLLILVVVLICAGIFFLWKVLIFFLDKINQINPAIATAIIGAMATLIAGIVAVLITQMKTKEREIAEAHRATKVEIYKEYLEIITRILQNGNNKIKSEPIPEELLIKYLMQFKTHIILWGSPQVIKAQYEFDKAARMNGNILVAVDNIYRAIREDIGLSNTGLPSLQLVKMYLSNPEELDATNKQ